MSRKGTVHIVKEGATLEGTGRYRAAFTVGYDPAEIESPQLELHGEQEVMQFIQRLLGRQAHEVRHYVDDLRHHGRVRLGDIEEDRYRHIDRAA